MVIRFASVRHLYRRSAGHACHGELSGGISEWDPAFNRLVHRPIEHGVSPGRSPVALEAERAVRHTHDARWRKLLDDCSLDGLDEGGLLLTRVTTVTQSDSQPHRQDHARVRAVSRHASGLRIHHGVTLPDTEPTEINSAVIHGLLADLGERTREKEPKVKLAPVAVPERGPQPVLLRGEAACLFVHEALGHLLEWSIDNERLLFDLGALSPLISLHDDPTSRSYVQYWRDSEDVPAQPVTLVDGGRVITQLLDRAAARRAGIESTGHGRRQDYDHRPLVRMSSVRLESRPGTMPSYPPSLIVVDRVRQGRMFGRGGTAELDAPAAQMWRYGEPIGTTAPVVLRLTIGCAVRDGLLGIGDRTTTLVHSCHKDGQEINVVVTSPDIMVLVDVIAPI